ncbi:alkyl/aryl-sulfatase [bacterium]|nr:alkyl/aryl-sulfatase [bacterium]
MNTFVKPLSVMIATVFISALLSSTVNAVDSEATQLLKNRTAEFDKEIIKVSSSVYTAVGYAVSPVSMIVGDDGVVIVDTGLDIEQGKAIRADFRDIVDKPVKAIIFTHGHPDHTHGASAFMDSSDVQVWAREGFGHEQNTLEDAGVFIQKRRGAAQAGFALTPEQRINNGVAKAFWPNRKGGIWGAEQNIVPNHLVVAEREKLSIAGIDLELVAATGETQDGLYIWLPSERVVFAGDNFYKSWPNLYAIRGSAYRDIRAWANVIDDILQEGAVAVVGGHTRPILGESEVNETLGNFRDAIRFLFDKTVEGINKGLTPNQLVDYVVLPDKYKDLDYLRPYYGNPEWAVRAIFGGYLGWFDGNATSLFPLSDKEEAERFARVAGGVNGILELATKATKDRDFQWSAQLSDYVLSLEPNNEKAMINKADALTGLADEILTATARNYYLSSAIELRKRAEGATAKTQ